MCKVKSEDYFERVACDNIITSLITLCPLYNKKTNMKVQICPEMHINDFGECHEALLFFPTSASLASHNVPYVPFPKYDKQLHLPLPKK